MDQDRVLEKPIIIVGSPRSGTTSASLILGSHPDTVLIGEPRMTWRWGNDKRSDLLLPEHATDAVRSHIRGTFAQRIRAEGGHRMVEKTPTNSIRMGFVERVFPDAIFVHTIRNPHDAVLSIYDYWKRSSSGLPAIQVSQRLRELRWRQIPYYAREAMRRTLPAALSGVAGRPIWGPRLPGIEALLGELDLLDVCCLQWRSCVEAACQYGRRNLHDRYFEYHVEDFSRDVFGELLRFVGLAEGERIWAEFEKQANRFAGRSRVREADPEVLRRITLWTEPTMRWLGYGCPLETGVAPETG